MTSTNAAQNGSRQTRPAGPWVLPEMRPISYVLLDEEWDVLQVKVKRKNRDQFFLTLGEAVTALTAFDEYKHDFTNQIMDLLEELSNWVKAHKKSIRSAHLTIRRDGSILFVVMQKGIQFDAELSAELTEVDIAVANNPAFDLIKLDVLAIPKVSRESANAFLSSGEVYTHA